MTSRAAPLVLEELDARTLPTPLLTAPTSGVAVVQPASHPLHGGGSGSYTHNFGVDSGTSYTLDSGHVTLTGLGSFQVKGWVQRVGMIQSGRATGELDLSNAHGTITLALHGPIQPGFGPLPNELVYSATGGTGAYKNFTGYGTVAFQFQPVMVPLAAAMPTPTPMPPIWFGGSPGSYSLSFS